jgi:hypothetical protein
MRVQRKLEVQMCGMLLYRHICNTARQTIKQ